MNIFNDDFLARLRVEFPQEMERVSNEDQNDPSRNSREVDALNDWLANPDEDRRDVGKRYFPEIKQREKMMKQYLGLDAVRLPVVVILHCMHEVVSQLARESDIFFPVWKYYLLSERSVEECVEIIQEEKEASLEAKAEFEFDIPETFEKEIESLERLDTEKKFGKAYTSFLLRVGQEFKEEFGYPEIGGNEALRRIATIKQTETLLIKYVVPYHNLTHSFAEDMGFPSKWAPL